MKKLVLLLSVILLGNICLADAPYIPKHLLESSCESTQSQNDNSTAFPFIPCTMSVEEQKKMQPKKEIPVQEPKQIEEKPVQKFGRFLQDFIQ